jgi:hypothetical protein
MSGSFTFLVVRTNEPLYQFLPLPFLPSKIGKSVIRVGGTLSGPKLISIQSEYNFPLDFMLKS